MSTDNRELGGQSPNTTSANYAANFYGQSLMSEATPSSGETKSNDSGSTAGGSGQSSGSDNNKSVWYMAGKSLVILLVIFGLVWGGRWAWNNYSTDESTEATQTAEVETKAPEPLPLDGPSGEVGAGLGSETIVGDDEDIPSLGPANPLAMTVGAAILAAALYRFSNLAHQPNRRP